MKFNIKCYTLEYQSVPHVIPEKWMNEEPMSKPKIGGLKPSDTYNGCGL